VENAGAVDLALEEGRVLRVLGDNDFRVSAAVLVNVIHRLVDARHNLDCALQGAVLDLHALGRRRSKSHVLAQLRPGVDLHLGDARRESIGIENFALCQRNEIFAR
jgi:hypothetical protein